MIVVDITLCHALGGPPRKLGSIRIGNTGEGTLTRGTYIAQLFGKSHRFMRTVRVEDFPRKRLLAHDLLYRVLREAVGWRNQEGP